MPWTTLFSSVSFLFMCRCTQLSCFTNNDVIVNVSFVFLRNGNFFVGTFMNERFKIFDLIDTSIKIVFQSAHILGNITRYNDNNIVAYNCIFQYDLGERSC